MLQLHSGSCDDAKLARVVQGPGDVGNAQLCLYNCCNQDSSRGTQYLLLKVFCLLKHKSCGSGNQEVARPFGHLVPLQQPGCICLACSSIFDSPSAEIDCRGRHIRHISSLLYADDVALLSALEATQGLQQLLDSCNDSVQPMASPSASPKKVSLVVDTMIALGRSLVNIWSAASLLPIWPCYFRRIERSSMPYKLASARLARLAPPWGPSSLDILICSLQTRYSCSSNCSRPSCRIVPRTVVKSGPQLMQSLSCFGTSSLCSTPSFAVLAVSRAASPLRSLFRSFL